MKKTYQMFVEMISLVAWAEILASNNPLKDFFKILEIIFLLLVDI